MYSIRRISGWIFLFSPFLFSRFGTIQAAGQFSAKFYVTDRRERRDTASLRINWPQTKKPKKELFPPPEYHRAVACKCIITSKLPRSVGRLVGLSVSRLDSWPGSPLPSSLIIILVPILINIPDTLTLKRLEMPKC